MKTTSNDISYINGDFTGILWGENALTILNGNNIIYQTTKHRKIDTYDQLVQFVDLIKASHDRKQ